MKARDMMTRNVVSVRPDTPTREIARILLDKRISAVPVIDENGVPLGMVSEGDLIGPASDSAARREWWLNHLAEGEALNPEFLTHLWTTDRIAREVMHGPLVTVEEDADFTEVARLLAEYRIKRVPVLREGRAVGIVSRADLLRALTQTATSQAMTPPRGGFLAGVLAHLDESFHHRSDQPDQGPLPVSSSTGAPASVPTAADFKHLVTDHERQEFEHRREERRQAAEQRRRTAIEMIERHVPDEKWRSLLHQACEAAQRGEKEFMLLRFPSAVCSDGGRAVNVTEADWPTTLRGEAAETYLRWERDLKPRGFHLTARVLDFPGGVPGDIGLLLVWE